MLTPAYNLTATERVLPRMALDFTTASLDARVTVTRALNTATAVNSSGYIATVNANLPRFDYNPTAPITCKGLLIEESRANLFLQSEALTSPWTIDGGGSLNATPTAAPDNANTAKKLQENTANTYFRAYQSVTLTNGAVYTASFFAKASGRDWAYIYFNGGVSTAYVNVTTKTVGGTVGSPTVTFTDYANGFTRVTMTFTNTTVGGQNVQVWLAQSDGVRTYQGDGSSGMYIWGFQLELGAFATSYIPTTTTSLTRNADVVSMTGTNFSSWFNASEGAFSATYSRIAIKRYSRVFAASNVAESEQITLLSGLQADGRENGNIQVAGVPNYLYPGNTPAAGQVTQFCLSYKTGNSAASLNASTVATNSAAFANPAPTQFNIGSIVTSGQYLNGYVQRVMYWPQDLTDAEVRAFAK